jgi:parvulin-like peptidyl-prolyl isomerase
MLKFCTPLFSLALLAQTPAPEAPKPPTALVNPAPMPPAAAEPKPGDVIAYLGKTAIRYSDFTAWLTAMAGPRAEQMIKMPAARAQAMKQYLDLQVLAAKGQKEKLQDTQEFKTLLAALRQQVFARVLMDEERAGGDGQKLKAKAENPTDEEVRAYFDANAERYATPEKFTARHILVSLKGAPAAGDKGVTEEEALSKLAKAREELKAGKGWDAVAKEYSDDPGSKNSGGLYKDIPFGRFAKEFEAAVRSQEIGKPGEPVKTNFGYHLIQVESRSPKQPGDFEKVKDNVRKQMVPERREKATKAYLEEVRKEVGFREVADPAAEPSADSAKPAKPAVKVVKPAAPKPATAP